MGCSLAVILGGVRLFTYQDERFSRHSANIASRGPGTTVYRDVDIKLPRCASMELRRARLQADVARRRTFGSQTRDMAARHILFCSRCDVQNRVKNATREPAGLLLQQHSYHYAILCSPRRDAEAGGRQVDGTLVRRGRASAMPPFKRHRLRLPATARTCAALGGLLSGG